MDIRELPVDELVLDQNLNLRDRLNDETVLRGGFGIFHPTGAAQGARDIMSRNPFRYIITNRRPTLQRGYCRAAR